MTLYDSKCVTNLIFISVPFQVSYHLRQTKAGCYKLEEPLPYTCHRNCFQAGKSTGVLSVQRFASKLTYVSAFLVSRVYKKIYVLKIELYRKRCLTELLFEKKLHARAKVALLVTTLLAEGMP